jgi:AraC-like DNA-binding protein
MGCIAYAAKGRITAVGSTASRVGQTARWVVEGPVFQLSMPIGSVFRVGRHTSSPTGPASVVIVPSAWEWTRISPPGLIMAIHVDAAALQAELQAIRPASGGEFPRSLVVRDIDPAARERLWSAAAGAVRATRPGADPQQLLLSEARLLAETVQLIPDVPAPHRPVDLSAQRVRDLEGWIDAHLSEPITLGDLCRFAGVGGRCLQRDFEHRRGMSPMRFVAERRLAVTGAVQAGPGVTVTQVALASGFDHAGRLPTSIDEFSVKCPRRPWHARANDPNTPAEPGRATVHWRPHVRCSGRSAGDQIPAASTCCKPRAAALQSGRHGSP